MARVRLVTADGFSISSVFFTPVCHWRMLASLVKNKLYHRFHRVQGGFLCVELRPAERSSEIVFQLRDVEGMVSDETKFARAAG